MPLFVISNILFTNQNQMYFSTYSDERLSFCTYFADSTGPGCISLNRAEFADNFLTSKFDL